jgi:hypothetical protein
MQASQLKPYSIGTVATDKDPSSKIVEVLLSETSPMADGAVTDNVSQYDAKGVDASGQAYQESVATTSTVSAEWLPMGGSNRMTAPDVRRGESVVVYRFADVDKYYWTTLKDDMRLRKLETVIWAFSGTTDESKDTDASTSYFFEVSTHQKLIHVHTSNANGEPFVYDIQINAKDGAVIIQDDIGQKFVLDSAKHILRMQNADGTYFEVNDKNATWWVPETMNVYAKNGKFMFTETLDIECPNTTHEGNFTEKGAFGLAGDMTTVPGAGGVGSPGTGKIQIAGQAELLGSMDVKGAMTAVTIDATEAIHAPNLKYN